MKEAFGPSLYAECVFDPLGVLLVSGVTSEIDVVVLVRELGETFASWKSTWPQIDEHQLFERFVVAEVGIRRTERTCLEKLGKMPIYLDYKDWPNSDGRVMRALAEHFEADAGNLSSCSFPTDAFVGPHDPDIFHTENLHPRVPQALAPSTTTGVEWGKERKSILGKWGVLLDHERRADLAAGFLHGRLLPASRDKHSIEAGVQVR